MLAEEENEWSPRIEERVATRDDDRDRAGEIFQLWHGGSRVAGGSTPQAIFAGNLDDGFTNMQECWIRRAIAPSMKRWSNGVME